MAQEEKQLLLIDLCDRLPHGVKILDIPANVVGDLFLVSTTGTVEYEPTDETNDGTGYQTLHNIKPYLRPMASMTEDEKLDYIALGDIKRYTNPQYAYLISEQLDYLNAHYFDYRGLIPMGLALEAPKGMYKTE